MKKRILLILCIIALVMGFTACTGVGNNDPAEHLFTGTIIEKNDQTVIVEPDNGEEIRSSGDKVSVVLPDNSLNLQVGDSVVVGYDGDVMESYPLQINLISIEKLNR
jgi:hypothetical protein